jgi:60 kDa SS-A/Ro ribonucleoprotein
MFDLTQHVATRLRRLVSPQAGPIPGSTRQPNSASRYAWADDHRSRLERFLVLGCEGGTYDVGERPLTRDSETLSGST